MMHQSAGGQRTVARMCVLPFLVVLGSGSLFSQRIPGDTVLARVERQISGVKDFTVRLEIVADIERLEVPPMHATLYFKQPDKVHLQSDGFAMLPKEASMLTLGRLAERFTAITTGEEEFGGKKCYRLGLTPKGGREFRGKLILLVDPERWTPERLETSVPGGRTATANFEQSRVGGFWLTSKVTVRLETAEQDSTSALPPGMEENPARRPVPRNGTITITYSNYKVNIGLSDSVFAPASESPERR